MATVMGFEGKLYYGTAGSTATTLITNVRDVTQTTDPQKGSTTIRGDGSSPPIETEDVTSLKYSIDWNMTNDTADTALSTMRAAAAAGTPVALRTKDNTSGKGFNGDVTVSVKDGQPLNGEATFDFTATPTRKSGRSPQLYV